MLLLIRGTIAGAIVWLIAVAVLGFALGKLWPQMAAIKDMAALTVPMLAARLSVSGLGSVFSGAVAAVVGRDAFRAPLGAGLLLLIVFVPYHLTIWHSFPLWYHLTFFASLPLLSLLGGRLKGAR